MKQKMLERSILTPLLLATLLAPSAAAASTIPIDRSFGAGGTVEAKFGSTYSRTVFTALAPQVDGTLLATRGNGVDPSGWIRRYRPDGSLDSSFAPQSITPQVEVRDAEGRLLRSVEDSLERLNPDGTPDPSFGVRTRGAQKVSDATGFRIERIVPLPSGKILVAGSIRVFEPESKDSPGRTFVEQIAVARFNPEGALDAGFGSGGIVHLRDAAGVSGETLLGIEPRPGEGAAIVVLEKPRSQYGPDVAHSPSTFVALDSSGHLDSSFAGGTIRTADTIEGFHILADGSLLLAGDRWGERLSPRVAYRSDIFVSRYTATGSADPAFGDGGSVHLDLASIDLLGATLWGEDGSVWLGGAASQIDGSNCRRFHDVCPETPFVVHVLAGGTLDAGFGSGSVRLLGELSSPYGGDAGGIGVRALAARPGGGVYAAGGAGIVAFIAAISPTGGFDPSFGAGGVLAETEPRAGSVAGHALAIDSHRRLLVAGGTDADVADAPRGALFRFLPDGELDRAFGGGDGYVRFPGNGDGLAMAADGGAFVLSGQFLEAVTKVREDGTVDPAYGEEGTVELPAAVPIHWRGRTEYLYVSLRSIAALSGGRVLVAGTAAKNEARAVLFRLQADGSLDRSFGDGGVAVRSCGGSRRCRVNQMVVQRDGRILLAGQVEPRPNEPPRSEAFAAMRLTADGVKDRSFGRKGVFVRRLGQRSYASALVLQGGGGILVSGRSMTAGRVREVLLRLRPDGNLDRSFGHRGVAAAGVPSRPGGFSNQPHQILLLHRRILVLRDSREGQLVTYSRAGRGRRIFVGARGTERENRAARSPFGAVQGGRLVLGWQVFASPSAYFKLQRLLLG